MERNNLIQSYLTNLITVYNIDQNITKTTYVIYTKSSATFKEILKKY